MNDSDDGDLSSLKPAPTLWRRTRDAEGRHSHSATESSDEDYGERDIGGYQLQLEPQSEPVYSPARSRGVSFRNLGRVDDEPSHDLGEIAIRTIGLEEELEDHVPGNASTRGLKDAAEPEPPVVSMSKANSVRDEPIPHTLNQIIDQPSIEIHGDNDEQAPREALNDTDVRAEQVSNPAETENEPASPIISKSGPHSPVATHAHVADVSEWSHQRLAPQVTEDEDPPDEDEWQDMPVYAPFDIYDDDGKLFAKEAAEESGVPIPDVSGSNQGGAAKGYTRVMVDEDAESATSMDDNTAYLFREPGTTVDADDEEQRDPLAQMQATKNLLTDNQKIAYVGVVRLAMAEITKEVQSMERLRGAKKTIDIAYEMTILWSQKMMVRLYQHMELDSAEQIMIEQLAEHGLQPSDLTPSLMQNARVKNPISDLKTGEADSSPRESLPSYTDPDSAGAVRAGDVSEVPPPYQELDGADMPEARTPAQMPTTDKLDIDIRWTVLCDLFLILIADSVYDARSRTLLERVGGFLDVPWLDICRFEKRITDALEMQEAAKKENWDEAEHMATRKKRALKRRLIFMGLATVGGGIVIGLSAGLLAPVIGAGIAAGFTTIGVTGTGTFLAGAGGAAFIGTGAAVTGGITGVRAANKRTGAVKTFEYRPLHNNKRVNLIVTVAGWMTGKVDDVRLPYSTVDPIMGDVYSILWEPEMLRSMGDTINILATEALTQGLQQVLGSTILMGLMAAIQLPMVLSKLAYLIDNPWSNSQARADMAGLILADSLIDRNLGARPITLVGFSLGSRVIFSCLRELAKRGAVGIIQNAYLFGSPVVVNKEEYLKAKTVVSGRFLNGYTTNDWILGYLFRATSGGISRVAGLGRIEIPGIENIDLTDFVPGHMSYRKAMPRILREVGWSIESDDFTEIEDPDPDNHENRQRELISEIEEARKELQEKPEKLRFGGFFRSNKKRAQKEAWETYDERSKSEGAGEAGAAGTEDVLFDIDAIRREAIELAAQGVELRQIETTLPMMKTDFREQQSSGLTIPSKRHDLLQRNAQSFEDVDGQRHVTASRSLDSKRHEEHNSHREEEIENIQMTFESPRPRHAGSPTMTYGSPQQWRSHANGSTSEHIERARSDMGYRTIATLTQHNGHSNEESEQQHVELSFDPSDRDIRTGSNLIWDDDGDNGASTYKSKMEYAHPWQGNDDLNIRSSTPGQAAAATLHSSLAFASQNGGLNHGIKHNIWADEDDEFGREQEMEMTFE